ncbi:MAG: c-type cytochrome [Pseudomonadota bacterium]
MRWLAVALVLAVAPAAANGFRVLEGHGGSIHATVVAGDLTATASFDNSVGLWAGAAGAPRWLEGHAAAVKALSFVGGSRLASAGDDQTILVWQTDTGALLHRLEGHQGPILSLAASPDGLLLASASWDKRIGIWDVETGRHLRWLEGHTGLVNDVVFDGAARLYSASYDGTVREWRVEDGITVRTLVRHGFGINRIVLNASERWLAYGALDGGTRAIDLEAGTELADLSLGRRPILALAMRPDGGEIAVGDGEGYIMTVRTGAWTIARDFRAAKGGPVWALTYVDGGASILAGGIENVAYVFPLEATGEAPRMGETPRAFQTDPAQVGNGERQFLRKCSVCHSLTADGGRKAGPTLYGLFGRRAGTVAGYTYSDALTGSEIVWSEDTVDRLFDLGPDHVTPGSKMPMQRIVKPADRADLISYLKRETTPD